MKKKTIAVLFGGHSTEYEVSLQSAYSVIQNLDPQKYDAVLIGITRQGEWLRFGGNIRRIANGTWMDDGSCTPAVISPDRGTHGVLTLDGSRAAIRIDAAFPVLHGKNGEDGTVQGLLEMAGIPCVGCGMLSSAICMDKDVAHRLVHLSGIKVPPCLVLNENIPDAELKKKAFSLKYPLFVKPANAGSSFGITQIFDAEGLPDAVSAAFQHDQKVIIEESVLGFEVGCAILGNTSLTVGEVDEIELSSGFFDYTEKYTLKSSKIHMPARIDKETADKIKRTAEEIYRALGCSGLARVDMFLTPEREVVFNEVNTIPGFTAHSRYPSMLKGCGLSMGQIIDELIRLAIER